MDCFENAKITKICCIGAGYVGALTSVVIASKCPHIRVAVVDINESRIASWNSNELPLYEMQLKEILAKCRDKNLFFSTNVQAEIATSELIFISLNTPTKTAGLGAGLAADTSAIEGATRMIAQYSSSSKIVVEKSTVPVKTAETIVDILKANKPEVQFEVLSNPEFLAEGTAIEDLLNPDRVLVGSFKTSSSKIAVQKLVELYQNWVPSEKIIQMNVWSSELAKLAANAFLAQRISSINSLSAICEKTGAEIGQISHAIGLDSRIGPHFLNASLGFGGSCFQKDLLSLVYLAKSLNLPEVANYWHQVVLMNEYQKRRFSEQIVKRLYGAVRGKKLAIFGFAFKANTTDTRESPAKDVIKSLLKEGAQIVVFDPNVSKDQIFEELSFSSSSTVELSVAECPYSAAAEAHAIVIATEWPQFRFLDYQKLFQSMTKPAFVFDGRQTVDAEKLQVIGFHVVVIGKRAAEQSDFL